jgi:hypothetical protein
MQGKQLAAYVACIVVFVACIAEAYDVLFTSPSTAPQEATVGLENTAAPWRPDPSDLSKAAVPPSFVVRSSDGVSVPSGPAAEQGAGRPAERRQSQARFATVGKSEPQSDEPGPSRADETADRQGREEIGEGHRNRYRVRAAHRGEYYSYRRGSRDENNFFGRGQYDYSFGHRDQYHDNYARRDSGAFGRGDRDRDRFHFGQWARDEKSSRSRQSRGVFGTFTWR